MKLAHRLAGERGFCHARHFLAALTSTEWADLVALETLDPGGEFRADWRSAVLAMLLYNSNKGRDAAPKSVADFLWKPPATVNQTAAEQRRILQEILAGA